MEVGAAGRGDDAVRYALRFKQKRKKRGRICVMSRFADRLPGNGGCVKMAHRAPTPRLIARVCLQRTRFATVIAHALQGAAGVLSKTSPLREMLRVVRMPALG